jgi:uncharacterized protein
MSARRPHPESPATRPQHADAGGQRRRQPTWELAVYLLLGVLFGIVLVKGEVISWYRIQEMFRFQGFHMYGVFAGALATAMPSLWLIRRLRPRAVTGEPIVIPPKELGSGRRYVLGGATFGVGWAFTGACPGPLLALLGAGAGAIALALLAAFAGTWCYGWLRPRLPH